MTNYTLSAQLERLGGLKAYNAGGADVDQSGWIRVLAKKLRMNQAGQGTVVLEYPGTVFRFSDSGAGRVRLAF